MCFSGWFAHMRRTAIAFLRSSASLLVLPTVLTTACGDDTTPSTGTDAESSGTEGDTDAESSGIEGDTDEPSTTNPTTTNPSTTVDPDTSTDPTINPESSSTDPEESSSTDPSESSSESGNLCGNDAVDEGEDCDGDDLNGADCIGEGFDGGVLACDACAFDTTACVNMSCGNDTIEGKEICDGTDLSPPLSG